MPGYLGVPRLGYGPELMLGQSIFGVNPWARRTADLVRERIPGARIDFKVDRKRQAFIDRPMKPIDDRFAREERGLDPGVQRPADAG